MSCNTNKGGVNIPRLMDLDVTYTGCGFTCGGVKVEAGMTIRKVLDILLSGCENTPPVEEATNFWFGVDAPTSAIDAKDDDYYLQSNGIVWQFDGTAWEDTGVVIGGSVEWGDIGGNIADQTDLLQYIQDNAITEAKVGTNLYLSDEGKLNVGRISEFIEQNFGSEYIIFGYKDVTEGTDIQNSGLIFVKVSEGQDLGVLGVDGFLNIFSQTGIEINPFGGNLLLNAVDGTTNVTGKNVRFSNNGNASYLEGNESNTYLSLSGHIRRVNGQVTIDEWSGTNSPPLVTAQDVRSRMRLRERSMSINSATATISQSTDSNRQGTFVYLFNVNSTTLSMTAAPVQGAVFTFFVRTGQTITINLPTGVTSFETLSGSQTTPITLNQAGQYDLTFVGNPLRGYINVTTE